LSDVGGKADCACGRRECAVDGGGQFGDERGVAEAVGAIKDYFFNLAHLGDGSWPYWG
jgi:hypothetical protein